MDEWIRALFLMFCIPAALIIVGYIIYFFIIFFLFIYEVIKDKILYG